MLAAAHLLVLVPGAAARRVPLVEEVTTIGSDPTVGLRLADPELKPLHAEIRRVEQGFMLVRHEAPLLVNGRRVRRHLLSASDLIGIGRLALSFRPGPSPTATVELAPSDAGRAVEICRRLYELTRRLAGQDDPDTVAEQMLADVVTLTGADHGQLVVLDESASPRKTVQLGRASAADQSLSRTALARLFEERRPILWTDTAADPDLGRAPSVHAARIRSLMCAPIQEGERLAGALYVSREETVAPFDAEALDLLAIYANQGALVLSALERDRSLAARASRAEEQLKAIQHEALVGSSPAMQGLLADLRKVAGSGLAVLLLGETGTGKELVARELHRLSPRRAAPFVAVHCGAIAESLLESELFGHARGAFTGAHQDRLGHIRAAAGGTLFLDEIGEMPVGQQAKLLRVLEDHRVQPLGGDTAFEVDFRLICATNQSLEERAAGGRFRRDLFFRIAGVSLNIPPLRLRGDDAVELAQHFLRRYQPVLGRGGLRFSAAALTAIRSRPWEGNVRELEAAVRRAIVLSEGETIGAEAFGATAGPPEADAIRPLAAVRDEFLKRYVQATVDRLGGNRTAAAEALDVSPRTVFKYLDEV